MRASLRSSFYAVHKYDLGCPKEDNCHLFKNHGGLKACELCPKHLKVNSPEYDPLYTGRINYLINIENMVNVGCKFGPNDLSPETWEHLIILHQERNWIRDKVEKQRVDADKEHPTLLPEAQKKIDEQRKEMGIPPPGGSLFSGKK